MKGNINKCLDSVIHLLMKYARDKTFDRIMKAEKGKSTRRTNIINKRHQESLKLLTSNVCMKMTIVGKLNLVQLILPI